MRAPMNKMGGIGGKALNINISATNGRIESPIEPTVADCRAHAANALSAVSHVPFFRCHCHRPRYDRCHFRRKIANHCLRQ